MFETFRQIKGRFLTKGLIGKSQMDLMKCLPCEKSRPDLARCPRGWQMAMFKTLWLRPRADLARCPRGWQICVSPKTQRIQEHSESKDTFLDVLPRFIMSKDQNKRSIINRFRSCARLIAGSLSMLGRRPLTPCRIK